MGHLLPADPLVPKREGIMQGCSTFADRFIL
jgi:hypothetical protein